MQLSELTLRLLLIFFPGIIANIIIVNLTNHRNRDFKFFLLYSYIMGLLSYLVLYVVVFLNNKIVIIRGLTPSWKVSFFNVLTDGKSTITFSEVFWATIVSILLGFVVTKLINDKFLHKFAKKYNISRVFGEPDVWGYIFESPDVEWALIRDIPNDLMYEGWVEAFSDTYENNELFLREVMVYRNSTSEFLYKLDGLYVTRKKDELLIEFRKLGNNC